MEIIQVSKSFYDPIPDGEYEVPGLKPCYRLVIKNNEGVQMHNVENGKIINGTGRSGHHTHFFNLYGFDGKPKQYTISRLVLCVRSGVEYEQLRNVKFLVNRSGLPVNAKERKPDRRLIKNIGEIEKTIEIVKAVQQGNVEPLHRELDEMRPRLVKYLWRRHCWKFSRLESVLPMAEELLYEQMMSLNVMSLPKLSVWYANCIQKEYLKNVKEQRYEQL